MKKILIIDFNNAVHRARAGFNKGDHSITFTFFQSLRKLVENFNPFKIFIVKEGRPQVRHDLLDTYKANRTSAGDDFWRQHSDILKILSAMPVTIVRHPFRECDDTIAHVARNLNEDEECVIISTDTDFIQLLNANNRIRLFNPVKDVWVEQFSADYVMWKSLVGDGSDNIPGFQGVGGKTAMKLLNDPKRLKDFLSVEDRQEKFDRNIKLISFQSIDNVDELEYTSVSPDWNVVNQEFTIREFKSLINPKYWQKYVNTFSNVSI